jgi:hypothetical protein
LARVNLPGLGAAGRVTTVRNRNGPRNQLVNLAGLPAEGVLYYIGDTPLPLRNRGFVRAEPISGLAKLSVSTWNYRAPVLLLTL